MKQADLRCVTNEFLFGLFGQTSDGTDHALGRLKLAIGRQPKAHKLDRTKTRIDRFQLKAKDVRDDFNACSSQ